MLMALKLRRMADDGGVVEPLVNWSLVREITQAGDTRVNLHFTDGSTGRYDNSGVDVELAIRKAAKTGDGIAKVRKPKVPKNCPICKYGHIKCPSCGKKAFCGAECLECVACGYVAGSFDEVDAAQ